MRTILSKTAILEGQYPMKYRATIYLSSAQFSTYNPTVHYLISNIHSLNREGSHTRVLFPLAAPQVLIYAVIRLPTKAPQTPIKAASVNPNWNSNGPRKPTARLFAVKFALNHNKLIWTYLVMLDSWRSSGSTRVMPLASRPAKDSILPLMRRRVEGMRIGRGVSRAESWCGWCCPFSMSVSEFDGDMIVVDSTTPFSLAAKAMSAIWGVQLMGWSKERRGELPKSGWKIKINPNDIQCLLFPILKHIGIGW